MAASRESAPRLKRRARSADNEHIRLQRIGDFVRSFSTIVNALELNPAFVADLAQEFPVERRNARLVLGKWSALEHIAHLARVEPILSARLKQMIEHPDRQIVPYNPDADSPDLLKEADWDDALSSYQWNRAALISQLRDVDPHSWERPVRHPEYREYSIRIMARHLALHDLLHAYRIEEMLLVVDAQGKEP